MNTSSFHHLVVADNNAINAILFFALALAYPHSAPGLRIKAAGVHSVPNRLGRHLRPEQFGEQYCMNCPFCGDAHGRLAVSYTYDPQQMPYAWYCYNERCQSNPLNRADLANSLKHVWPRALSYPIVRVPGLISPVDCSEIGRKDTIVLPAGSVLLSELHPDHPSRVYLRQRGFDAEQLAEEWQVAFSERSSVPPLNIEARIIIPVVAPDGDSDASRLVGWQARAIGNSQSRKYLMMRGFEKSRWLYMHASRCASAEPLIVCEGATDVWRFGHQAVALFGKSASPTQMQRLVDLARRCNIVWIALDSDAEKEATALVTDLRARLNGIGANVDVKRLRPPAPRKDFGECSPEEVAAAFRGENLQPSRVSAPEAVSHTTVGGREACRSPRRSGRNRECIPAPTTVPDLAVGLVKHATGNICSSPHEATLALQQLGMFQLYESLECPLLPVIQEIQQHGLLLDEARLDDIVSRNPSSASEASRLRRSARDGAGRVFTELNQLGTRTGRISAKNYPLQNLQRPLRNALIAGQDRVLLVADYRQYEWRVAAWLSQDPELLNVFRDSSVDFYDSMAAGAAATDSVTQEHRHYAKRHLMRLLYSSARDRNVDQYADQIRNVLRTESPQLWSWLGQVESVGRTHGNVVTFAGRRVRLPADSLCSPMIPAVNYLIQATAADLFKAAILTVRQQLETDIRILLPHHDSLLVDCPSSGEAHVRETLRRGMETPWPGCDISLQVEIHSGSSWGACV